jgi:exopolyphosphatase/guanosine-5'-triphosphate,3'-diphosphate pyrophosphatase
MVLQWGTRLHEIGLDISHSGFQKHGAYIVANADLPGFPRSEQLFLAFLIAAQRQRIDQSILEQLPAVWHIPALRLCILQRLAVLLNRSRSSLELPEIKVEVGESSIRLEFPQGWLDDNPLTITDLERERNYLEQVGYDLTFS